MTITKNYTNEIDDAIGIKGNILPSVLDGYEPIPGFPDFEAYPGGYCRVYPLVCDDKPKMCIRLWHRDFNKSHVKELANTLKKLHDQEFIIGYEYYEEGLRLQDGEVIPAVVMDWIEGDTLGEYIQKHKDNPSEIGMLAHKFYDMCAIMHNEGVAHGDLSAENIIVKPDGSLILIDYDSFFIPNYQNSIPQTIVGTPGFQHRDRSKMNYVSSNIDNFSQQVIYLSLLAIARDPSLADPRKNLVVDKKLFFESSDFLNEESFVSSQGYKAIASVNDTEVQNRLAELRQAVCGNLSEVKSIVEYNSKIDELKKEKERLAKELEELKRAMLTGGVTGGQTGTPWYKQWYVWAGIVALLVGLHFYNGSNGNSVATADEPAENVVAGDANESQPAEEAITVTPEVAKAVAMAIERMEGNYTLREKVDGSLVNGIRTCAIKKSSSSQGQILVTSEYSPEIYDFTFNANGKVSSDQLGTGEITYKEKFNKITITFKQGDRTCEFTK